MQLLAILLSLGLNQSTDVVDRFRKPAWFHVYAAWVREKALPLGLWNGAVGVVVLLAPLFAAGVALQWWLAGLPLGLNQLLLGVPALLFAFGTDRTDDHVARFVESWSAREMGAAREAAAALNPGRPLTVEEERLPEFAVRGLFSHVHERLFGALFWFLILGPVGALAYRLTALARDFGGCHANAGPGYCDAASGAFWLVSWIPARLTAASFAVAGSFSHCIEAWRSAGRRDAEDTNAEVLMFAGLGALGVEPTASDRDLLGSTLADARALLHRTRLLWLAVVAFLTLTGWVA